MIMLRFSLRKTNATVAGVRMKKNSFRNYITMKQFELDAYTQESILG